MYHILHILVRKTSKPYLLLGWANKQLSSFYMYTELIIWLILLSRFYLAIQFSSLDSYLLPTLDEIRVNNLPDQECAFPENLALIWVFHGLSYIWWRSFWRSTGSQTTSSYTASAVLIVRITTLICILSSEIDGEKTIFMLSLCIA